MTPLVCILTKQSPQNAHATPLRCTWKIERGKRGEIFLLTVGAFLLTVKLLGLQSLKALIRRTFPL